MNGHDKAAFQIEVGVLIFLLFSYGVGTISWDDAVVVLLVFISILLSRHAYNSRRGE